MSDPKDQINMSFRALIEDILQRLKYLEDRDKEQSLVIEQDDGTMEVDKWQE